MDVVPVEGQNWETDPFVLTDKNDGKLYGRGTCDMKGFLACCLAAIPKMMNANLKNQSISPLVMTKKLAVSQLLN